MNKTSTQAVAFNKTLAEYKHKIDSDIEKYCQNVLSEVHESFGKYPVKPVEAYCEILSRGGKRIRGALTITGYKMLGGKDEAIALQAARVIEMLHAYILMIDDIQDRSEVRRGGKSAHIILRDYHAKKHLKDDSQHFGESIALNGSLFGVHSAINVLAELDLESDRKIRAIKNINQHFISTVHGQSLDIFNEVVETVDESAVDNVLLWKTAFYTFMNPLQLGAILAGAEEKDLKKLEQYSLHAGRVFQITDDIIGVFGEEDSSGKSPLDDIKEGKRTLLTVKALEMTAKADGYFLDQMMGNKNLTQSEFQRCRDIIVDSGALEYSDKEAKKSVSDALIALGQVGDSWGREQVSFLEQLVKQLVDRKV